MKKGAAIRLRPVIVLREFYKVCNRKTLYFAGNALPGAPQVRTIIDYLRLYPSSAAFCWPGGLPRHGRGILHNLICLIIEKNYTVGNVVPDVPHADSRILQNPKWFANVKILYCRGRRPRRPAAPMVRSACLPLGEAMLLCPPLQNTLYFYKKASPAYWRGTQLMIWELSEA